tara:strand:- start:305 stop:562 length:258 start_codon:yes stop_codon:yes gene_type:complete
LLQGQQTLATKPGAVAHILAAEAPGNTSILVELSTILWVVDEVNASIDEDGDSSNITAVKGQVATNDVCGYHKRREHLYSYGLGM